MWPCSPPPSFETSIHTLNARHSPKYFGLKKGVVSYTLVANNVPINAYIIGANEHESHYVFDILFNNTTDIQPEIHSTDTHGTNEVNFALLHVFGYQFAPRYKDLYDKVRTSLHGFQHPSRYGNAIIRPVRKARKEFIINEWDNVQRILVSLALKATTQSTIVSKLSAYARNNRTKRALWEYDNIIQSLYLLNSYRLCILTPKRTAGRKSGGKLSPTASHDLLCQLWKAAIWDRIRATPLVRVQPTDRQLHRLLQRHAPLSPASAQGEPVRHARSGHSEAGFSCRMATRQSIRTLRVP